MERYKYPRTYHLPWSHGRSDDDKVLHDLSTFEEQEIVIIEKMDGENCLDENTIITTDKGNFTIKEIVKQKLDIKVLSMDEDGNLEYQQVLNYFMYDNNNNWYEIESETGEIIRITGEHPVYLPKLNCYRKVKYLWNLYDLRLQTFGIFLECFFSLLRFVLD